MVEEVGETLLAEIADRKIQSRHNRITTNKVWPTTAGDHS